MLLILSNASIPKHYCLCLNPCLDIPAKILCQNFKIHVIKHDMDPNSNINYSRKIPPLYTKYVISFSVSQTLLDKYIRLDP